MNRIQKRCLLTSVSTHLSLLLVLVLGSAFITPKPKPVLKEPLKIVPSKLVDDALSGGGGNPKVKPSEDKQKKVEAVQPPKPAPKPVEPKKPEVRKPPEPKPKPKPKPTPKPPEPKPKPKPKATPKPTPKPKPEPKLELKKITASEAKKNFKAPAPKRDPRETERLAKELTQAKRRMNDGFSQGTKVEVHGTGGIAYANYAQLIMALYDDAWFVPASVDDREGVAKARVIIMRSGVIKKATLIRGSGNAAMDATVRRALNAVNKAPPFPSSSKDREREFIIDFNLKVKLGTG